MRKRYDSKYRGYKIVSVNTSDKSKRWLSTKGEDSFYSDSFVGAMNTIDDKLAEQKTK